MEYREKKEKRIWCTDPWMFDLHRVENFAEVWASEVGLRFESGEYASSGHSLEVFFANVL
jgi:hypothetical protein